MEKRPKRVLAQMLEALASPIVEPEKIKDLLRPSANENDRCGGIGGRA